jgi:hypothetical protein
VRDGEQPLDEPEPAAERLVQPALKRDRIGGDDATACRRSLRGAWRRRRSEGRRPARTQVDEAAASEQENATPDKETGGDPAEEGELGAEARLDRHRS